MRNYVHIFGEGHDRSGKKSKRGEVSKVKTFTRKDGMRMLDGSTAANGGPVMRRDAKHI